VFFRLRTHARFWLAPTLVVVALTTPGAAWPQGTGSPDVSVTTILARMREAAGGGERLARIGSLRAQFVVRGYGFAGRGELHVDLPRKAYRRSFLLGPASESEGNTGHDAWLSDATGDVRIQNGSPEARALVDAAYRETFALFFPERWPAKVTMVGQIDGNLRLHVAPQGGATFFIDVNPRTYRVIRTIERVGDDTQTTTLGDYRRMDGILFPFTQRFESEAGTVVAATSRLTTAAREDRAATRLPVSPVDKHFANGRTSTTVPIQIANHHVYVAVSLNGGVPGRFLLDTGAQNIVSPAAAKRLGLQVVGGAQGSGSGENLESFRFTDVSKMQIGDAVLEKQPFVVLPFVAALERSDDLAVDGAIGFEVLKRFVTRIDFKTRTLTLALAGL